jgi:hypothetical protein
MNWPFVDELITKIREFPASDPERVALITLATDLAEANDGHLDWPKPYLTRTRLMPAIAFNAPNALVPQCLRFCIEDPDARTRVAVYTAYPTHRVEYIFRNPNLRELMRRFATYATTP